MTDETEDMRRARIAEINAGAATREALEAEYGPVYDTQELGEVFEVKGFMAPFVVVKGKSDGQVGSLEFRHHPRFYFNFVADKK